MPKLLLLLLLGVSTSINAQTITPEVIATSGDYFTNSNVSIAWTIGEVVIETQSSTNNILTQGFHQPDYSLISIFETNNPNFDIIVFPNPVQNMLNIKNSSSQEYQIVLLDCQGKIIARETVGSELYQHDLQSLSRGIYMLNIYIDNTLLETFKLIKTTN